MHLLHESIQVNKKLLEKVDSLERTLHSFQRSVQLYIVTRDALFSVTLHDKKVRDPETENANLAIRRKSAVHPVNSVSNAAEDLSVRLDYETDEAIISSMF
jgi:hypothetical protein